MMVRPMRALKFTGLAKSLIAQAGAVLSDSLRGCLVPHAVHSQAVFAVNYQAAGHRVKEDKPRTAMLFAGVLGKPKIGIVYPAA